MSRNPKPETRNRVTGIGGQSRLPGWVHGQRLRVLWGLALISLVVSSAARADPFADAVVSFTPGAHAGFGADQLPGIVLGPPKGGGDLQGSLDVVSLGDGGSITLAFLDNIICDGPGPDFTVFENAFHAGSATGPLFTEVGIVAVSQDGENFITFAYDPVTFAGLAGQTPVYSNPDNGIDPTDPAVSGGDHFDLADVGLPWAAYVRITDPGDDIPDSGSRVPGGISAGFDLDALAALHSCAVSDSPTPSPTGTATASATPTDIDNTPTAPPVAPTETFPPASPTSTATAVTPTAMPTLPAVSPTPVPPRGDINGDGIVDEADLTRLIRVLFGDDIGDADINADARVSSADCLAFITVLEGARP